MPSLRLGDDDRRRAVHGANGIEQNGCVLLPAQDAPNGPGNIGRRQPRGRDLIQQRLKEVIVLFVDYDHVGVDAIQALRCGEASEAGANDDNSRSRRHC
jgi:hypothetical protein